MTRKGRLVDYLITIEYDIVGYTKDADHSDGQCRLEVTNTDKERTLFEESSATTYQPHTSRSFFFSAAAQADENFSNDTIEVCLEDLDVDDSDGRFIVSYSATLESDHTHKPDPGISEEFGGSKKYPSNVDVLVNGSSMGTSIGSGNSGQKKLVDISGQLSEGINVIEATSDTIGHIRLSPLTELYRRGATD